MNDHNNEKVLKSYIATSGYTIRALEDAIAELKETIRKSGTRDLIPIFQERVKQMTILYPASHH